MSPVPVADSYVQIDPHLLGEAIFHAVKGRSERGAYDRDRALLYAITDPEQRESEFRALDGVWFARLDLGRPLLQALEEQPAVRAGARTCVVGWARRSEEEGADLHVSPGAPIAVGCGAVTLVVQLQPESFGTPDRLLALLRRELQHVADILSPAFGYEPCLPSEDPDPARRKLRLDRYSVLWNITVEGRLSRRGQGSPEAETICRRALEHAFPMLRGHGAEVFERFWNHRAPTHPEMAVAACAPEELLSGGKS
jgi:hypothetical protein